MSGQIYLNFSALLYTILIFILFFTKEKVKSIETSLYGYLIIVSLLELVFGLISSIIIVSANINPFLYQVITKVFFAIILSWIYVFSKYIININKTNGEDDNVDKKIKIIDNIADGLYFFFVTLIFLTRINIKYINGFINTSGASMYCLGIASFIFILLITIIGFKNINKKDKRFVPLWAFVGLGIPVMFVQIMLLEIFLVVPLEVFITSIMYHTIENPDMKMIRELQVAREQADKANRSKTDFLSSMSHEIRTPLNAIVGFSDCIMESNTLSEAKENATDIVNASQTLLEIVNGILDISKIEAGKIEIINNKYNAPETYLELAKLITPKMKEKGLDFSYNIAPDLPETLFGDHANLKKIVTNLLSNACKYTDRGFVHYEVNCVNSKGVCKLIISVEDSGRGIRKESMDKMFTKFQRLDEDKNTTIEGTGLGLAITKQLTELMGGRIFVHTIYGTGSKFTVVVNQKIEKADDINKKTAKTTLDLTGVRLLLVDDNPLNLKVATKLLEKFNANHIITSDSGFDCLEKIKRGEVYDIILLDDMMPKMSGVETLTELKKIDGFNVPVVALTANAITGVREKYLAEGFNDYLAKPIEKTELIRVVNELLGRNNTEDLEEVVEQVAPIITNTENVRDEVIVTEEKIPYIIPVEENIEEILGSQLDLSGADIVTFNPTPIKVDHIDTDNEHQIEVLDIIEDNEKVVDIPDLIPVVDIDINSISNSNNTSEVVYDRTYLESNGVDVNHGIELLGDMEMYNMTINDFYSEINDKWSRIISYRDNHDMENYAIDVHSLKSDCKYLGFMSLADVSYEHELKSKANDLEFVLNDFPRLESEYNKMYDIVKNYVEHNDFSE